MTGFCDLLVTGIGGTADLALIDDQGEPVAACLLDPVQAFRIGMQLVAIATTGHTACDHQTGVDGWLDDDQPIPYRIARPIRVHRDVDGTWRVVCRDHAGCAGWHFTNHKAASYIAHHHAALRHTKEGAPTW